jgi:hypothetical protein
MSEMNWNDSKLPALTLGKGTFKGEFEAGSRSIRWCGVGMVFGVFGVFGWLATGSLVFLGVVTCSLSI